MSISPTIAIMTYGGVTPWTLNTFVRDRALDTKYHWSFLHHEGDAAVDRARSIVATKFLEGSDSEVLLMVDHDLSWGITDATYLVDKAHETKGVVGSLVSKRVFGEGFGARLVDGKRHEIGSEELIELEEDAYMGAAFLAISRDALQAMADRLPKTVPQGFYPFFCPQLKHNKRIDAYEYLSEDWAFTHGMRVCGRKVYLAMLPVVRHYGHYGFTTLDGNHSPAVVEARAKEKAA